MTNFADQTLLRLVESNDWTGLQRFLTMNASSSCNLSSFREETPETNWYLFNSAQLTMLAVRTAPSFMLPLLLEHLDARHIFPSSRNQFNENLTYNMSLLHDVCLDHKHEAVTILLQTLDQRIVSKECKRVDFMVLEIGSEKERKEYEFLYTPLQTAWEPTLRNEEDLWKLRRMSSLEDLSERSNLEILNLWLTSVYLILGMDGKGMNTGLLKSSEWSIIHAILKAGPLMHSAVLWFALKLYPELITMKDPDGNYPIHLAASNFLFYRSAVQPSLSMKDENSYHREEWERSPIHILLEKEKASASLLDDTGRLPLHLLLANHNNVTQKLEEHKCRHKDYASADGFSIDFEESIESILQAYPSAIEVRDPQTGLYPFMLAASVPTVPLTVIYKLLCRNPTLVSTQWYRKRRIPVADSHYKKPRMDR